jgi:hypothetical protein
MRRFVNFSLASKPIAVAVLAAAFFLAFTPGRAQAQPQSARILRGRVPEVVSRLRPLAEVAAGTHLQLAVGLPLRNKPALTNLIQDLYNPGSGKFHKYLSVPEFTEQFGPTADDYRKVTDYLTSHGLKVTATHPNRMIVDVAGAAADVEKAFHVKLHVYQHPTEQRTFFSPDTEPYVDADVPVLDVMGLDNYIVPHPMDLKRPLPIGQGSRGGSVTNFAEEGSGPNGTYIGKDFRAAYVPTVTNTGTGQFIALVEFGPYWPNDVPTYEAQAGLSNITISNIFLDGVTEPPAAETDAGEQALDIEMCISMAPGATVLYYGGNVVDDIYSRIATDNLGKQISCSFGFGIDSTTEQLYQEFVAQGQNFFEASGDGGAEVGTINPPACEPYITLVGGTALYTVSPGGAWQQELTWVGSGGGVSTFYAIPNYQQGINMAPLQGSSTMRNFPDVAMMADTVIFIAANNGTGAVGGTSCSSPQYAGFYALANQQAASLGQPPLGFFNPALYAIGKSSSYTTCFHDITSGNTTNATSGPKKFFAATGYDLCTGWGSPNGINLINTLTSIGSNTFFLYATPVELNLTVGGSGTVLMTDQPMNGFSGDVSLSVSNLPTGTTASFSPASTSSTSVLTLTAGSTASPGAYSVTLYGVSGSITQTVAVTLNIQASTSGTSRVSLSPDFNISAIHTDGSTFGGGADGGGNAYSANLLGSALNWNGCLFNEGAANANNAIQCSGQTISLPEGKYTSLQILAAAVGGAQMSQQFVVTYSDSSTVVFTQSLSDWTSPQGFPGETVVDATAYRDTSSGTKDTVTEAVIYGYSFSLNNTKSVISIKLPDNGNVLVFAMTLANDFTFYGPPTSIVLAAGGESTSYIVSGPTNGFTGEVSLSTSGLPAGVTATFNPTSTTNSSILTLTASATAQPVNANVALTGTLGGLTHNINVNLSIITPIPGASEVNLASDFNILGISGDGKTFSANGGFDGAGNAYSDNLLGSAPNWDGCPFSLVASGGPEAVQCAGQTIALPTGQYTGLLMLGAAVNASQPNQTFEIHYADGTSIAVNQSISVWTAAQNYAGESVAFSTAYVDTSGGTNNTEMPVNIYGYVLGLNDSKTIQSVTLPNNTNVVILAMTVANTPTTVSIASAYNRAGIYTDGHSFSGGLDGGGYSYSANQLGSTLLWDSVPFKFGAPSVNDVISCGGQTITLPANRYTTLLMLATGVDGNQSSQAFTVTYTDGTTTTLDQSFSDWVVETNYPDQLIAATMPYRLNNSGSADSSTTHLYGYIFQLNNTKTVQKFKLPSNGNLEVLAISLANTPLPVSLQADYNRAGIYSDGAKFTAGDGLDNDGNALSATLLGQSESWHNMLFAFGPANATNVVSGTGQTVALPQGQYSSLLMLGTSVNGAQTSQPFTVTYTNGTISSFSLNMSDWANPQHYSDETIVVAMGYRDSSGGSKVGPAVNLYGYSMALNPNNVVESIKLPNNSDVQVLAITLSNYTAALPETPAIVTEPQSLTVTNGNPASFVVAATGSPTLQYQWQLNSTNLTDGGNITGSSTEALTLAVSGATNAGSYDVIVSNPYGSVTSSIVTLNVVFSFQSAVQATNGNVTFSWLTTPGVPYQVQYTTNLASTNWMNLGAAILASNSVTTASDNFPPDPQRFYRIIQQ